jgi:tetratricopeptide (TPR) repeat protein
MMPLRTACALLCAAALFPAAMGASPAWAAAQEVEYPQVERARKLIEEAEFDEALRRLSEALAQPDNGDELLAALYELQGTTYLYLGREAQARTSFEKLLQAAPDYELPRGTSSKIRKLFEAVREDARARRLRPVRVIHEPLDEARAEARLDVSATIEDMPAAARARLYFRRAGSEGYSSAGFAPEVGARYAARIPAFELPSEPSSYALEYYIEVSDAAGRRLAGAGDALKPFALRVPGSSDAGPAAAAEDPWYRKWWVWTLGGAVAAGAAAAVAVPLLTSERQGRLPVTIRIQP